MKNKQICAIFLKEFRIRQKAAEIVQNHKRIINQGTTSELTAKD